MTEIRPKTPEEIWAKTATPKVVNTILFYALHTARALELSPEEAGEYFADLDVDTANNYAFCWSGWPLGELVRQFGESLKRGTQGLAEKHAGEQ